MGYRWGWAGPWPGRGPFSYLPPWQRPGWLFGRGACWWLFGWPYRFAPFGWPYYPWPRYPLWPAYPAYPAYPAWPYPYYYPPRWW